MPDAGNCTSYLLIIETATITVPSVAAISDDCTAPNSCCTPTNNVLICDDDTITLYDGDMCESDWVSDDTTGLGPMVFLQTATATLQLPAGSTITSTDCHVLECDDTIDLDCEC